MANGKGVFCQLKRFTPGLRIPFLSTMLANSSTSDVTQVILFPATRKSSKGVLSVDLPFHTSTDVIKTIAMFSSSGKSKHMSSSVSVRISRTKIPVFCMILFFETCSIFNIGVCIFQLKKRWAQLLGAVGIFHLKDPDSHMNGME